MFADALKFIINKRARLSLEAREKKINFNLTRLFSHSGSN